MQHLPYIICELKSPQKLDEIHKLTYSSLLERKDIAPNRDKKISLFPHLDTSRQTTILVAENRGKIIGTNSVSMDGPDGLPSDLHFPAETDEIRKRCSGNIAASWRIATSHEYRRDRRLILEIMKATFRVGFENNIDTCLFIFNQRHVDFYKRLFGAEVVSRKLIALKGREGIDASLLSVKLRDACSRFQQVSRVSVQ